MLKSLSRLMLCAAVLLPIAGLPACADDTAAAVALGAKANGQTVKIAVGSEISILLDENVTTGYSWDVVKSDPALVSLSGHESQPAATPMPGAPGKVLFRLKAIAAGTSVIELGYRRPWETGVAPVETFSLNVEAK
ncbi:protease inhibitor I42 family protein [Oryzibacter oryziterrae]|uniref:protease inhibitor I42 family protein n=1 Tax=Oryzibacter oryziterrae TaxID=2766474 RepID=UPI001F2494F7|nr:protease inhibitor I42 family protein [Oryzibacter oryziterrae]